jgi:hypothetical protein
MVCPPEMLARRSQDLRALEAAGRVEDPDLDRIGMVGGGTVLYPSLHLNLADVYRRLGEDRPARLHVERGREALNDVEPDGYAEMIRQALDRVEARLKGR